jgi:hypothetical protein
VFYSDTAPYYWPHEPDRDAVIVFVIVYIPGFGLVWDSFSACRFLCIVVPDFKDFQKSSSTTSTLSPEDSRIHIE